METNLNPTTEAQHDAKLPVMCGFCRDCKYCESDFEFNQLLICKHPKLKLSAVFTYDGCQFGVEEDFGCVQFENRTQRLSIKAGGE